MRALCQHVQRQLLSPRGRETPAWEVKPHLESCQECQDFQRSLEQAASWGQHIQQQRQRQEESNEAFWEAYTQRLYQRLPREKRGLGQSGEEGARHEKEAREERWRFGWPWGFRWGALAATVATALLLLWLPLPPSTTPSWRPAPVRPPGLSPLPAPHSQQPLSQKRRRPFGFWEAIAADTTLWPEAEQLLRDLPRLPLSLTQPPLESSDLGASTRQIIASLKKALRDLPLPVQTTLSLHRYHLEETRSPDRYRLTAIEAFFEEKALQKTEETIPGYQTARRLLAFHSERLDPAPISQKMPSSLRAFQQFVPNQ